MPVGTLSQVQIDSFNDRGFLVVPDLLHSDEVGRIAAAARGEFETHRYMDAKARFPAPTKYTSCRRTACACPTSAWWSIIRAS